MKKFQWTIELSCKLQWGASSRWSFGPNSALVSIETKTIGKTHPTLQVLVQLIIKHLTGKDHTVENLYNRSYLDLKLYFLSVKVT